MKADKGFRATSELQLDGDLNPDIALPTISLKFIAGSDYDIWNVETNLVFCSLVRWTKPLRASFPV